MPRSFDEHSALPRLADHRRSHAPSTGRPDDAPTLIAPGPGGRLIDALFELQRTAGNRQVQQVVAGLRRPGGRPPVIQPKLLLGPADDHHEREADRIARIVGAPGAGLGQPAVVHPMSAAGGGPMPEEMRHAVGGALGGGRPVPDEPRRALERTFGADFGDVRLHTDGRADQLNQALQSKAFTVGKDIFFRRGDYSPATPGGRRLLAHELTHVVQQGGGQLDASRAVHPQVIQRELTEKAKKVLEAANKKESSFTVLMGFLDVIDILKNDKNVRAKHLDRIMELPPGASPALESFVQACLLKYFVARVLARHDLDDKKAIKSAMADVATTKGSLKAAGYPQVGGITPELHSMLITSFGALEFGIHGVQSAANVDPRKLEVCATYIPGRKLDALMRAHSFILYTDKQGRKKFISAHTDETGILKTETDDWSPTLFSDPRMVRQMVATGDRAADAFSAMLIAAKIINNAKLNYAMIDQNCNSAAHYLLTSAGLGDTPAPSLMNKFGWSNALTEQLDPPRRPRAMAETPRFGASTAREQQPDTLRRTRAMADTPQFIRAPGPVTTATPAPVGINAAPSTAAPSKPATANAITAVGGTTTTTSTTSATPAATFSASASSSSSTTTTVTSTATHRPPRGGASARRNAPPPVKQILTLSVEITVGARVIDEGTAVEVLKEYEKRNEVQIRILPDGPTIDVDRDVLFDAAD